MNRLKLGRAEFSGGFLLLCAWLLYWDHSGTAALGLLACLLHEAGHCAALQLLRNGIKGIYITMTGAKLFPAIPMSYRQEFVVAAAGPAVNLLLAHACCTLPSGQVFAGANLALAAFNLLPIRELDGARMVRCLLAALCSDEVSFAVSRCLSFSFTAIFALFGLWLAVKNHNLTLLMMCFWVLQRPAVGRIGNFAEKEWK